MRVHVPLRTLFEAIQYFQMHLIRGLKCQNVNRYGFFWVKSFGEKKQIHLTLVILGKSFCISGFLYDLILIIKLKLVR